MLFSLAVIFILVGTFFFYRYAKELRVCVLYSNKNQLDILGWEAKTELRLMSDVLFFIKLLGFGNRTGRDMTQTSMLESSKKELLKALVFGLIGGALGVVHILAH
ncbi:MAG: hypothetical protein JKY85_03100 [Porticoccus sp.]|nr:hypothetical protein [Porticoccus sp.]